MAEAATARPPVLPSGEQWTIRHGDRVAVIVEVGGGLRTFADRGEDIVAGFPDEMMAPSGRGQILVPWPNRLRDGRYTFDGEERVLPITEPATGNASHGLTRWSPWTLRERHEDRVIVSHTIHPRPGWDATVEVVTAWSLDETGLVCQVRATNVGTTRAPFGYGAHPYLALGATSLDRARLTVPAADVVLVDERKLPADVDDVEGTPFNLREGVALADVDLDHALTALTRGEDGCWVVELDLDDRQVRLWGDQRLDWVQVFTGKMRDAGPGLTPGVAIEPLSCPADAFNSGLGLVVLEPGDTWSAQWGIEVSWR